MATIGDSGAPSSNTIYYDALLSTTLNAYRKQMIDNIFKESAFLAFLKNSGAIKKQDGGERVQIPLMYGSNSTVKTHSGAEVIDTSLQDGMTASFYEWAEIAGTIGITRREERQNAGEGRLISLLESKIKQAEMTMSEYLNSSLINGTVYGSTFVPNQSLGGSNGVNPLGYFFRKLNATDPTRGGNVGNISGASYSWWRHKTATLDGTADTGNAFTLNVSTYAGLKAGLHRMFNYCGRGAGGSPDVVITDQITYETYVNALDQQMRYYDSKMADMGFQNVKLLTSTMLWDEIVPDLDEGALMEDASTPAGTAFFINTKFYNLIIDSITDMTTTPFVEPENQTVKTAKVLWMGQACVSNMRKHGVCYAISQSITS